MQANALLIAVDSMQLGRSPVSRWASLALVALFSSACVAGGGATPGATGDAGGTISRDAGERRLMDACMYGLYQQQQSSEGLVQTCRCASDRAMDALPGEEFVLTRSGDLGGEQRSALNAGVEACRRA